MEHPVLSFLMDYFTNQHLKCILTDGADLKLSDLDLGLRDSILKVTDTPPSGILKTLEENTLYYILDYYVCNYFFFRFPDQKKFLFIGPYLTKEISDSDIYSLMNSLQIPSELFPQLRDYYDALPCLPEKHGFSSLLEHAYTTLFSGLLPAVRYLDLRSLENTNAFLERHQFIVPEDPVLSMHLLEERYRGEDELLSAVSNGNTAKALSIAERMRSIRFSPRSDNALRHQKNLMITFNSLLRRTAYEAGVHPYYIDVVSSNYARLIEQGSSIDEISDTVTYMIKSYCHLVEKRSMAFYSEPVRQILVTIDASLTSDLSLKRFANELFLNTSYLSTLFKKEVGMTLTDYVNKNRIEYATKLLKSTTHSIQDIAVQCGIPDIHYFTRLFRRIMGVSPREWRNQ